MLRLRHIVATYLLAMLAVSSVICNPLYSIYSKFVTKKDAGYEHLSDPKNCMEHGISKIEWLGVSPVASFANVVWNNRAGLLKCQYSIAHITPEFQVFELLRNGEKTYRDRQVPGRQCVQRPLSRFVIKDGNTQKYGAVDCYIYEPVAGVTLHEFIRGKSLKEKAIVLPAIFQRITAGVAYLRMLNIAYNPIAGRNILIQLTPRSSRLSVKIYDYVTVGVLPGQNNNAFLSTKFSPLQQLNTKDAIESCAQQNKYLSAMMYIALTGATPPVVTLNKERAYKSLQLRATNVLTRAAEADQPYMQNPAVPDKIAQAFTGMRGETPQFPILAHAREVQRLLPLYEAVHALQTMPVTSCAAGLEVFNNLLPRATVFNRFGQGMRNRFASIRAPTIRPAA
ncbi:hypothetical protein SYNPS1DRAFT_26975 [Syncephalis pseudoplumigaleata]|uniref:Protein kinase domain-containing protein n=1 Tax=Syncephalis pseudoplumigaleata TaxID=1712513 RepID=A0A4P9Z6S0_9FUNG|nr:hypothetical protein SYNPS1DRAFT_26975 [Syncephalis pseudoplumigaleata]|eukprot:RKP27370.1 hypothetical protein SYNPS1DRAFT_26975 [Syncephalis pseudoplumigaleata]